MPPSVKHLILCSVPVISLLFTISLSSCGKIGDPIPPAIVNSPAKTDMTLRVEQKSDYLDYCRDESNMPEKSFQEKD
jgi:predicted small lipoprotein YifL